MMISEESLSTGLSEIMYEKIRPPMANSPLTTIPMRPIVVFFSKFLLFPLTLDLFFLLHHYILSRTLQTIMHKYLALCCPNSWLTGTWYRGISRPDMYRVQ